MTKTRVFAAGMRVATNRRGMAVPYIGGVRAVGTIVEVADGMIFVHFDGHDERDIVMMRENELDRLSNASGFRGNPDLLLMANPPKGREFGKQVIEIRYRHSANGKPYKHPFGKGVKMEGLPDGSVRLYHPSHRIWEDM